MVDTTFDVEDFLVDGTTPESTDSIAYTANNADYLQMSMVGDWSSFMQQQSEDLDIRRQHMRTHLSSHMQDDFCQDRISLQTDFDGRSVEPKKARRQAQNKAAYDVATLMILQADKSRQRAFRERKEKYIQELEEKVVDMNKEINELEQDRRKLEGLLKVARAEVETLKSIPPCLTSQLGCERNQIACTIDGLGRKSAVVLTFDLGTRKVSISSEEQKPGTDGVVMVEQNLLDED